MKFYFLKTQPFKKEESEEDQSWNDMENVYLKFD